MNKDLLLKKLPVSIFFAKLQLENDNLKFLDFQLIKNAKFSDYSEEELTLDLILRSIDESEFKRIAQELKNKKENEIFTVTHHFKARDNSLLFFKNYVRILERKENILKVVSVLTDFSKELQLSQIFETILNSPNMGIIIYKDKIVLANEAVKKILEIEDEIFSFSIEEIFPDKFKIILKEEKKRRLSGEKFNSFHLFELKTFKNKRKYIEFFSNTIIYEGSHAGFMFVIDKTQQQKNQILLDMSLIVNSLIIDAKDEKNLLGEIKEALESIGFFSKIVLNERLDLKECLVNNNYNHSNFKSYCYMPIVINNDIIGSFSFYSEYKEDFSKKVEMTLKEIQRKIIFALKGIRNRKNLIILKQVVHNSYEWILITDKDGTIIYVNDAVEHISKYKKNELLGKNPRIFRSDLHNERFFRKMWNKILKGEIFTSIFINRDKTGKLFYLQSKIIPVKINNELYFVSLAIDITKEKLLEKKIEYIKYQDTLTNIYNREGFLYFGNKKLKEGKNFVLFIIDIEDFKLLNEIKGFRYGDFILKNVTRFLKKFFKNALIGRVGNDDFAVLMEFSDLKDLSSIIHDFLEKIEEFKFSITINVGIAIYPKDADNINDLIEKAFVALSFNQKLERNSYNFYNKDISLEIQNYLEVKNSILEAIKNKSFIYHFQPYVNSTTLNISGAESLLRMYKNKLIMPNVFIDYAEKSGIIKKIELLMMEKLIDAIKDIKLSLSFNLSGFSLKDEAHIKKLIELSREYSKFITIEITERELIDDLNSTLKILELLKKNNYKIAIDDFGTGYSSLTYISSLPIDIIKIDISFVRNMLFFKKDLIIVETIIDFAKKLNLKTIAEGVENKEQVEILKKLGCDCLQGYYFYKPMPLEKLKRLLN